MFNGSVSASKARKATETHAHIVSPAPASTSAENGTSERWRYPPVAQMVAAAIVIIRLSIRTVAATTLKRLLKVRTRCLHSFCDFSFMVDALVWEVAR